jgi:hypothetical protein
VTPHTRLVPLQLVLAVPPSLAPKSWAPAALTYPPHSGTAAALLLTYVLTPALGVELVPPAAALDAW